MTYRDEHGIAGKAARQRSAALQPRNAGIRAHYDELTTEGLLLSDGPASPAFARKILAHKYGLTTERIAQICKERRP